MLQLIKTLVVIGLITFKVSLLNAQDTIYYYKNGLLLSTRATTEIDSIVFYRPQLENTITDYQGNIYKTVVIGPQTWMAENLRSTRYNDGTPVPLVINDTTWKNLITPGYCWFNHDSVRYCSNKYGALYNWYVVETGKICPTGWHVPSDSEWADLENYLIENFYNYDGSYSNNKIAKSLADTLYWPIHSKIGSIGNTDFPAMRNKTGFSALPSCERSNVGNFGYLNSNAVWWSSTSLNTTNANYMILEYWFNYSRRGYKVNNWGYSIRCLKD